MAASTTFCGKPAFWEPIGKASFHQRSDTVKCEAAGRDLLSVKNSPFCCEKGVSLSIITLLGIAVGLAMDAFTVAVVTGAVIPRLTIRHFFRLCFHFGLFQALMPVVGWLAGRTVAGYAELFGHWIALAFLGCIGGKMIWNSYRGEKKTLTGDPTRGLVLVGLSVATSIDALAVGLSLAMLGVYIVVPAIVIGLITAGLSITGMILGSRVGRRFNHHIERFGGALLIAIGIKIVVENIW